MKPDWTSGKPFATLETTQTAVCHDCGFTWRRGHDGSHSCVAKLKAHAAALAVRVDGLEAEVDAELRAQVEISEGAGRMHDKLSARIAILEAVVAPLLPLFRERVEVLEEREAKHPGEKWAAIPDTINLTAEFPVAALRALISKRNRQEEEE